MHEIEKMNSNSYATQPTLNLPYLFVTWKLWTVSSKIRKTSKVTSKIANAHRNYANVECYAQASLIYSKFWSKRVFHARSFKSKCFCKICMQKHIGPLYMWSMKYIYIYLFKMQILTQTDYIPNHWISREKELRQ